MIKTPYQQLEVTLDSRDAVIKQAYLKKVKLFPPDRDPTQFHLIHNAYLAIKDHKSRVKYDLFTPPSSSFDSLIDQALTTKQPSHLTLEGFNTLLQLSIDNDSLLKAIVQPAKT